MKKRYLILIPLLLSGFTHLWNPVGFPDIFFDEGVYMRRAMNVLQESSPQEAYLYDHPYFGQIILAGFLGTTGYPNSLNVSSDANSLKDLYMIPRIFMGLFNLKIKIILKWQVGKNYLQPNKVHDSMNN